MSRLPSCEVSMVNLVESNSITTSKPLTVIPVASVTSNTTGTVINSPGAAVSVVGIEIFGSTPVAAGGVTPDGNGGTFETGICPITRRILVVSAD